MFKLTRKPSNIAKRILLVTDAVKRGVTETVREMVEEVYDESQALVPVDKGDLKASGMKEVYNNGETGEVSYGTDHCLHVEFGTYKMAAQPYLRPAAQKAKNRIGQRRNQISTAVRTRIG